MPLNTTGNRGDRAGREGADGDLRSSFGGGLYLRSLQDIRVEMFPRQFKEQVWGPGEGLGVNEDLGSWAERLALKLRGAKVTKKGDACGRGGRGKREKASRKRNSIRKQRTFRKAKLNEIIF